MKKFWEFRNSADGKGAELLLYGDIASEQSWFGDEVTPKQFARDLDSLGAVEDITVRVNSGGGDVFAAQAIGNLLESHAATVTARIDGVCASAATIVACHCDKVIAANDSTYMIHPVKMGICGYVDAATLQQFIDALNTLRENIITLYARKTCKSKDEVAGWMDATSWWTGEQAKEKGFVDELTDEEDATVYENRGGVLFVNSVETSIPFDKAPAALQMKNARQTPPKDAGPKQVQTSAGKPGAAVNIKPAGKPGKNKEAQDMGKEENIKTVDDLRKAYPALGDQLEQAAADAAAKAERERIRDIEEMTLPGSEAVAARAKFEAPMSAADFAKEMVKNAKTQGAAYLDSAEKDAEESGVDQVKGEQPAGKQDTFLNAIKGLAPAK